MNKHTDRSTRALGLAILTGTALGLAMLLGLLGARGVVLGQEVEMHSSVSPPTHFAASEVISSATLTATTSYTHYFPIVTSNYIAPVWTWLGPPGTDVQAVACDPSAPGVVYLGTQRGEGVYKSTDGGDSWTVTTEGLVYGKVLDLAIDPVTPNILYAATWGGEGVQKTVDGGDSWLTPQGPLYSLMLSVAIDPTNTNTVYAGSGNWEPYGGWIFKSQDGGATWAETSPEFTNALAIVVDWQTGSNVYAGTRFAGIKKSTDVGQSWSSANNGLGSNWINAIVMDPNDSSVLYAGTKNGGFKSIDGASSWITASQGLTSLYVNALAIDPSNPTTIYAGTKGGVFKSTNGGASWSAINQELTNLEVQALAVDPSKPQVLYAGTNDGVWRYGPPPGDLK